MDENSKPYQAIIKGKRCKIAWDENHDNVLLVDGVPHGVRLMKIGTGETSCDAFRKKRLLFISEFRSAAPTSEMPKDWLLDGKSTLQIENEGEAEVEIDGSVESRRLTYHFLNQILWYREKLPAKFTCDWQDYPTEADLKNQAVAVAYVHEDRIAFKDKTSILLPIFLSRFKPVNNIPYPAEIIGERVRVQGWDEQENLLLANGERYEFEPVEEPSFKIAMRRLISVRSLVSKDDEWVVDGDGLHGWLNGELARVADTVNRSRVDRGLPKLPLVAAAFAADPATEVNDDPEKPEFHPLFGERQALDRFLNSEGCRDVDPNSVSHVAWFDGIEDPLLLHSFRLLPSDAKHQEGAHAAAKHLQSAADVATKQIRAANSELRATAETLAEVAHPFREMYKDQRLAGAKADARNAGIPELVVDTIVRFYHTSKIPTTDGLTKFLNSTGGSTELESAGHGTSRPTFGRWLTTFKSIMRRRGLIQPARPTRKNPKQASNSAKTDQSNPATADTRAQELPEGSGGDE